MEGSVLTNLDPPPTFFFPLLFLFLVLPLASAGKEWKRQKFPNQAIGFYRAFFLLFFPLFFPQPSRQAEELLCMHTGTTHTSYTYLHMYMMLDT